MTTAIHPIGIIGAGTMGAGIAQVAATCGWPVFLLDVEETVAASAISGIHKRLHRLVEKKLLTAEKRDEILPRLQVASSAGDLKDCDLVIEAIVENLAVKVATLSEIAQAIPPSAVIASNTSSLSITQICESLGRAFRGRVVGMHFFNPAPLMPLVEVVAGQHSSPDALKRATLIAEAWGKTVVHCRDTPGFIVNRVARPYYLEGFRILEEGFAGADEIDKAMRELGGFKMGPLELTDLIGQDINAATTQSIYEQLGQPARLRPSQLQRQLVNDNHLGRKTDRGVYHHGAESTPALQIARKPLTLSERQQSAVERFVEKATDQIGTSIEQYVFARILVAIINEAAWALTEKIATAADIDTAMKLGTNYPKGPLEWAEEIGHATCGELLDALNATDERRYEAADILKAPV